METINDTLPAGGPVLLVHRQTSETLADLWRDTFARALAPRFELQVFGPKDLPESARECVKFHHHVEHAGAATPLAAITAYANHLSHLHGTQLQWFVPDPEAISDELARRLKLSHDANEALVESVVADFQQAGML